MLFDCKKLDKSVPIPLYFQLKELVLNEIKKGNYKEGDMIPTENVPRSARRLPSWFRKGGFIG